MALRAVPAELAVVHVVLPVTAGAGAVELDRTVDLVAVTRMAIEAAVLAVQGKRRPSIVIEIPREPCIRVVARFAGRAEALLVGVVLAVAVDALLLSIEERFRFVARVAGRSVVLT